MDRALVTGLRCSSCQLSLQAVAYCCRLPLQPLYSLQEAAGLHQSPCSTTVLAVLWLG